VRGETMALDTLAEFEADRAEGGPYFWLGKYVQTIRVGPYAFVEYLPHLDINNKRAGVSDAPSYAIYADGKSTSRVADCIDIAMVLAVAYKHDGQNSRAASYFARMVGLDTR
jgi:hypothetical protein